MRGRRGLTGNTDALATMIEGMKKALYDKTKELACVELRRKTEEARVEAAYVFLDQMAANARANMQRVVDNFGPGKKVLRISCPTTVAVASGVKPAQ